MEQSLLAFLILITLIGVGTVAGGSFFAFGGVQRYARAQLASGSYSLLVGLLFALVFSFPEAQQIEFPYSDYYANNWLASGLYVWCGSVLLLGSLAGFGLRNWLVLVLVSVHSILFGLLVAVIVPWKWPVIALSLEALDVAALMLVGIILAERQQRRKLARRVLVLAVGGVLSVALVSVFLGSYYLDGLGRRMGPPYIDGPVTLVSLVLGLFIFLASSGR
jgi:hypothetical protein